MSQSSETGTMSSGDFGDEDIHDGWQPIRRRHNDNDDEHDFVFPWRTETSYTGMNPPHVPHRHAA